METRKDQQGNVIHWLDETYGLLEIRTYANISHVSSKILYRPVMKVTASYYITLEDHSFESFDSGIKFLESEAQR